MHLTDSYGSWKIHGPSVSRVAPAGDPRRWSLDTLDGKRADRGKARPFDELIRV
jgi:hypothetical protein